MPRRACAAAALTAAVLAASPSQAAAADGWMWPVAGEVITPYRNGPDPYAAGQHRGIDIAARAGEPVAAATGGSVRYAGVAGSSGLTVSVRTGDGRFDTSYLHLSSLAVREGDRVRAGRRLGTVGMSGRRSASQPHLHFGVREAGSRHAYRDPLDLLPPPSAPTREAPRAGPAPAGAPVRAAPAPVSLPLASPAPRPRPAPRWAPLPAGRRIRVPGGGRAPRAAMPRLGPSLAPAAAVRGAVGAGGERPAPHGPTQPALGPRAPLGPVHLPAPGRGSRSNGAPESPAAVPASGPDLGWALACTGLLLAAACLGRPGARGSRTARRRSPRSPVRPVPGDG